MSKKKKNQTKAIRGREKTCDEKKKKRKKNYQIVLTQNNIIKKIL